MSHIHEVEKCSEISGLSMQEADEFVAKHNNYLLKCECPNCGNDRVVVPIKLFVHEKTVRRMCYCHKCMNKFTFGITK